MDNDQDPKHRVPIPPVALAPKPAPSLSAGPAAAAAAAKSAVTRPSAVPAPASGRTGTAPAQAVAAAALPVEAAHAQVTQEHQLTAGDLSTVELIRQITSDMRQLIQKEIELAKTELKADIKAEAFTVGGLSLAAIVGLCTLNLLLVTVVLALALVLPGWLSGLIVSGATLIITVVIAAVAWRKRVRSPLARTKRTLKEDVQWTRERLT